MGFEDDSLCPCGHSYGCHSFNSKGIECSEDCGCKDGNANGEKAHIYLGRLVEHTYRSDMSEIVPTTPRPCEMAYCRSKKLTKHYISAEHKESYLYFFICEDCISGLRSNFPE